MKEAFSRPLELYKFGRLKVKQLKQTRQQLRKAKQELERRKQGERWARRQLKQTRQQLRKAKQELERRKQREEQATEQLKQTRQQLKEVRQWLERRKQGERWARRQLKQVSREYLLCKVPKCSVCAEIGVHEGAFSQQILETVKPKRLHLIDTWKHEELNLSEESWYGGPLSGGQAAMDKRYRHVREQFAEEIRIDQIRIHRDFSSTASGKFKDHYFDWIYIDGNHSYEFVKQDLELYYPKVKVDGYIMGDDYGVEGWWENGVQKAVDEFVSYRPELMLEVKGTQFLIKKGTAGFTNRLQEVKG